MTMTALAMDLADQLIPEGPSGNVRGLNVEEIVATFDVADNVYLVIKDTASRYLWVNEKFANLVQVPQTQLHVIDTVDTHTAHMEHDQEVINSGIPLSNFLEDIAVPDGNGGERTTNIRTQKGLWRSPSNPKEILGITACFSILLFHSGMKHNTSKEQFKRLQPVKVWWLDNQNKNTTYSNHISSLVQCCADSNTGTRLILMVGGAGCVVS
jgi:hypothetical protein